MSLDQEIEATEAQLKVLLERKKQFANPMARALEQLELEHCRSRRGLITKMIVDMAVASKKTQVIFTWASPLVQCVSDYMDLHKVDHKYNELQNAITLSNGSKILTCRVTSEALRGMAVDRIITTGEVTADELERFTVILHGKQGEFVRVNF